MLILLFLMQFYSGQAKAQEGVEAGRALHSESRAAMARLAAINAQKCNDSKPKACFTNSSGNRVSQETWLNGLDAKPSFEDWQKSLNGYKAKYKIDQWQKSWSSSDLKNPKMDKHKMEGFFDHLSSRDEAAQKNIFKQMNTMMDFRSDLDPYLVMSIGYRESGSLSMESSTETINTYSQGGLDYLWSLMPKMKADGQLPKNCCAKWSEASVTHNEHGSEAFPANVPKNELLIAYSGVLTRAGDRVKGALKDFGFPEDTYSKLNSDTRRMLTALSFGGSGGSKCTRKKDAETCSIAGVQASSFGLLTVLSYIKENGKNPDSIFTDQTLLQYERTRKAVMWSINAGMLQKMMCFR